ncbi:hypothetical protein CN613_25500 [Bacillus pseudomycoides]|uniref:Uncharacterized protein n=1 Tax=Bacillus pseudomycoides TaxID=64104 RepID=A0A2A8BYF0_9BACI|nr:hypothetical protein [Bacillus pseudomycoides]PEM65302.1 hypothetical protein CN613_25500 [Bacillus pseudomycoides]
MSKLRKLSFGLFTAGFSLMALIQFMTGHWIFGCVTVLITLISLLPLFGGNLCVEVPKEDVI